MKYNQPTGERGNRNILKFEVSSATLQPSSFQQLQAFCAKTLYDGNIATNSLVF